MATNKKKFLKLHGLPDNTSLSIEDMSNLSGIPSEALQLVYNRGIGAYTDAKTGKVSTSVRMKGTFQKGINAPASMKLSKQQWAAARCYAFLMKTKKVYYGADNDIREHYGLK